MSPLAGRRRLSTSGLRLAVSAPVPLAQYLDVEARAAAEQVLAKVATQVQRSVLLKPYSAEIACEQVETLDLTAVVTAFGSDSDGDCASSGAGVKSSLDSCLAVSTTVKSVVVLQPPSPPPSPPPLPGSPPLTPPEGPQRPPPREGGYEAYNDGDCLIGPLREGVGCPHGCQRSLWSTMFTWDGQREEVGGYYPSFKGNVTIKPCTTVVLDVDMNVQLFSLVIWGTLIVENRANANILLKTTCITIKPGGRLLAGRPSPALTPDPSPAPAYTLAYPKGSLPYLGDGPFQGKLHILLSGDEMTASPHCGGFPTGRAIVNEGHLALHGARPTMVWSWLRHSVAAGSWKLTVKGHTGWLPDDVVMIASTGDSEEQTETRTVLASRMVPAPDGGWDTEVVLTGPLSYAHHAETEMHNGHVLELRAEVGVISRPTIKVAGVDALDFANDFLFITMQACKQGGGCGLLMKLRGRAVTALSGVLIQDGGLVHTSLVLPIITVSSKHTTIEGCVVNPNYGHGISASSGTYHGNLVYHSATGMLVGGTADVRYNAIFSVRDKGVAAVVENGVCSV